MKLYRIVFLLIALLTMASCNKDDHFGEVIPGDPDYRYGHGVFILNEGNYGNGNGSVSFFNPDSLTIVNDIFYLANKRPLGDVPFSMNIIAGEGWIVVNNSAKIEIVDLSDFSSKGTVTGFTSPRFLLPVQSAKAYVSDLYAGEIAVVNMDNLTISDHIVTNCSAEQMLLADGKVFAAFWSNYAFPDSENNFVLVIDPGTDAVTDTIFVGKEPNTLVTDNEGMLWVLCSGGYTADENPTLWRINPADLQILLSLTFPGLNSSPSALCCNGAGDMLYFLDGDIYGMAVSDTTLPQQPLIGSNGRLFYALGVHPETGNLYVSDAVDYQQRGVILRYRPDGTAIDSYRAGIIPGRFVFIP